MRSRKVWLVNDEWNTRRQTVRNSPLRAIQTNNGGRRAARMLAKKKPQQGGRGNAGGGGGLRSQRAAAATAVVQLSPASHEVGRLSKLLPARQELVVVHDVHQDPQRGHRLPLPVGSAAPPLVGVRCCWYRASTGRFLGGLGELPQERLRQGVALELYYRGRGSRRVVFRKL